MKKIEKHTVYFIGGPARVGKTTVAEKIMRRHPLIMLSTDGIRSAINNIFLGESHVSLEGISFKGTAAFRRPGSLKIYKKAFAKTNQDRDDLAWLGALGLIEAYDRANKIDVLVEGNAVTPERVHQLKLKNLTIRSAFIGYNNESHLSSILAYSKKKKDWIHRWIQEHDGDDTHVKKWVREKVARSVMIKKLAKKFGYGYFDVSKNPFNKHIRTVIDYLLKE
jgi:2-phosphoglycerate kinase